MGWIKRNLYFVIGSAVALLLMGLAGFYLYSKWNLNKEIVAQLDEQYNELTRLNGQNPHPGEPGKVDNVEEAKNQQKQLRDEIAKAKPYFQRIAPIPDVPKLTDYDFSRSLSRTIDQLQKDAATASVTLPPKSATGSAYSFSFEAQKSKVSFSPGSLTPLAAQLGEVKAICDILFQSKINSLDSLRRESISADDAQSTQGSTDYHSRRSVTNELAVLSPYEITFRGFSSELAAVLAGFASSPNALIVKTISVEQAPSAATEESAQPVTMAPVPQQYVPPPTIPNPAAERAAFERRYGGSPESPNRNAQRYIPPPQPVPTPGVVPAPATTSRGGLPTVLDEKKLKVTLTVDVVKLIHTK